MIDYNTPRRGLAAVALAAALICGAGAASAAPVQVTLDFGPSVLFPGNLYVEDGFEVSGNDLFFIGLGNPTASVLLGGVTPTMTVTRVGGGAFSLIAFDYACDTGTCALTVGNTAFTSGSSSALDFATVSPSGFSGITSLQFSASTAHLMDNIVLSYDDMPAIPLPAGLPLLLGGLAGLGMISRRKDRPA